MQPKLKIRSSKKANNVPNVKSNVKAITKTNPSSIVRRKPSARKRKTRRSKKTSSKSYVDIGVDRLVCGDEKDESFEEIIQMNNDYFAQRYRKIPDSNKENIEDMNLVDPHTRFSLLKEEDANLTEEQLCLVDSNRAQFEAWFLDLECNFNVLLYGLGSKKALLDEFADEYLTAFPMVRIHGFFPDASPKAILTAISRDVLDIGAPLGLHRHVLTVLSGLAQQSRHIYMVVHNIDGPALRSTDTQDILAQLASSPFVHLIASIDHVRATLLWDTSRIEQFGFMWRQVTTLRMGLDESLNQAPVIGQQGNSSAMAVRSVLDTLTAKHRLVLNVLAHAQLQQDDNRGLPFDEFLNLCLDDMLVKTDSQLRQELRELMDHQVVMMKRVDGSSVYRIPHSHDVIRSQIVQLSDDDEFVGR